MPCPHVLKRTCGRAFRWLAEVFPIVNAETQSLARKTVWRVLLLRLSISTIPVRGFFKHSVVKNHGLELVSSAGFAAVQDSWRRALGRPSMR